MKMISAQVTAEMGTPVPAPRLQMFNEQKKPIPTPRKLIPISPETASESPLISNNKLEMEDKKENENQFNTFSRRVRTFGTTSKQLTEEIAGKVQEKKKAVIEGTRQSVRKITRRFTTAGIEPPKEVEDDRKSESDISEIFSSISFESPLRRQTHIYNNVEIMSSSEDDISLPPPLHPPPPLREDSIYDQPLSLAESSTSTSSGSNPLPRNPYDYESVFPSYPYNSETDSCIDMTAGTIDKNVTATRSESWNFYDPVSKTENIYSNVDSSPVLSVTNSDVNTDIIERNSNLEVRNTMYENHIIIRPPPRAKKQKRPSESVILQFDPLTDVDPNNYSNVNDLKALEELLQGDLYGSIGNASFDNWSDTNESVEEYMNPPTPPVRFDSLPEETEKSKTNWFVPQSSTELAESPSTNKCSNVSKPSASKSTSATKLASDVKLTSNSKTSDVTVSDNKSSDSRPVSEHKSSSDYKHMSWFKQVNEVLKKAPEVMKLKQKGNVIARPALAPKGVAHQRGMLYKITNGPVEDLFGEFSSRWCVLEYGTFICYSDNNCDSIKESFPMQNIMSLQALVDQKLKYKYENEDLHCLEINVSGKSRGGHVYGSRSISERRVWMQRLAESLTNRFGAKITSEYSRIGWAYVKEGVSGEWAGVWLVLSKRTLYYAVDNCPLKSIDLRKARCIFLQNYEENEFTPTTTDKGPNMVLDYPNGVLYLRMWTTRETKAWSHIVHLAAHNNGALLEQQQLTKNNIPVIVEKSINFIYAHGSMSEGIYRRAGSGTAVLDILTKFRRDAWAVQLTTDKYTEHDVATALKRFFRDLPEPLLTTTNRQYLYQVSLVKIQDEKIRMFRAVFDQFTPTAYKTVRRLLGHLHFITTQHKNNLMTVENLATIWGPTLMHYEEDGQSKNKESVVLCQLISLYKNIFPENPEEIEQERLMLQVLERCTKSPQGPVNTKASGDLRVWVYLHNKEGETYNVAVGPQKTAYEVCLELCSKTKFGVHELQLEEIVLNDSLIRPVHHTEKVLDVVLRWGYWDEADRKDNCLILSPISKYWEYIQEKPSPVAGELKFADSKTKTFKMYTFEFAQAKLSYYKDKTCSVKLGSWNIEDILWYVGNEPRRNPQSRWTITFITRKQSPNRTKSAPYFGSIIAWSNPGLRASWLAAMLKAEHPQDLTPPPQHVNLMNS